MSGPLSVKLVGRFFARVVVGLGSLQLIGGTIGLLVWGNEEVRSGGTFSWYYEKPNLSIALASLVPNLLISSLLISFGAYIFVRLSE